MKKIFIALACTAFMIPVSTIAHKKTDAAASKSNTPQQILQSILPGNYTCNFKDQMGKATKSVTKISKKKGNPGMDQQLGVTMKDMMAGGSPFTASGQWKLVGVAKGALLGYNFPKGTPMKMTFVGIKPSNKNQFQVFAMQTLYNFDKKDASNDPTGMMQMGMNIGMSVSAYEGTCTFAHPF